MHNFRGEKSMAQGTERRPECERAWYKVRVIIPHCSLLGMDANCVPNIFSLYLFRDYITVTVCQLSMFVVQS